VPTTNQELAEKLAYIGKLYRVAKDQWRARTYEKVAGVVRDMPEHAGSINLLEVEGIGKSTAETIHQILETGTCKRIEELEKQFPPGAFALQAIPGVGPVSAFNIARLHGVESVEELIVLLEATGDDPDLLERAKIGLEQMKQGRLPREVVKPFVEKMVKQLKAIDGVYRCSPAGSFRRESETVKDVDILLSLDNPKAMAQVRSVAARFGEIQSAGDKKITLRYQGNFIVNVDLLIVDPLCWGAALCYFTGSKAHNIRLRGIAKSRGILVNEYGFFKGPNASKGDMVEEERIGGEFEVELYDILKVKYVDPKDRSE